MIPDYEKPKSRYIGYKCIPKTREIMEKELLLSKEEHEATCDLCHKKFIYTGVNKPKYYFGYRALYDMPQFKAKFDSLCRKCWAKVADWESEYIDAAVMYHNSYRKSDYYIPKGIQTLVNKGFAKLIYD